MQLRLRDHGSAALFLALGLTLVANILLPLQDALTKQLIVDLPVWAVLFVRSTTVFAATLLIGRKPLVVRLVRTPLKRFMAIRALIMLGGWTTFYLAVRHLPLAQAITLYFVSPILVTIAAKPFLGERTPLLQWIGILAGLVGVALASGLVEFELSAAIGLALLSACFWAASLLMLRSVSKEEGTLVQVAFCNGVFAVVTFVPVLLQGFAASASTLSWMVAVGFVGGAGQFCLYEAARRVPAPVLSALEYTSILSAFALGYLMFGDVPTPQIWVGAVLILTSGMVVVAVERDRIKSAAPLARDLPVPAVAGAIFEQSQEGRMTDKTHDAVVSYIAKTRFPFPGQKTWAADYQTLTNVPQRKRAIKTPAGDHYPDIVILDGTGRVRELGEVEMTVSEASVATLKATSETADTDTPTKVRHFFLYVPLGQEKAAQSLLEDNKISYAGLRTFSVSPDGAIKIVPFVTPGDSYDHQVTE